MARTALRILAVVVWIVLMVMLVNWSSTDAALALAAIATVAAGAVVGTWWVLLVPAVPFAVLATMTLLAETDGYHEVPPWVWAVYIAGVGFVLVVLLALGVALHRLVAGAARLTSAPCAASSSRSSSPGASPPSPPRTRER